MSRTGESYSNSAFNSLKKNQKNLNPMPPPAYLPLFVSWDNFLGNIVHWFVLLFTAINDGTRPGLVLCPPPSFFLCMLLQLILELLQSLLQTAASVTFLKCKSDHPTTVSKIQLLWGKSKEHELPNHVWLGTHNLTPGLHVLRLLQVFELAVFSPWIIPLSALSLRSLVSVLHISIDSSILFWSNPWSPTTYKCDCIWRNSFQKGN